MIIEFTTTDALIGFAVYGIFTGLWAAFGMYFGNKLLFSKIEKISKNSVEKGLEKLGYKIEEKK